MDLGNNVVSELEEAQTPEAESGKCEMVVENSHTFELVTVRTV